MKEQLQNFANRYMQGTFKTKATVSGEIKKLKERLAGEELTLGNVLGFASDPNNLGAGDHNAITHRENEIA
jgi:hypothetical protein